MPAAENPPLPSKAMKVLVCGGVGYIGSHAVRELHKQKDKYEVVILDNLSKGHPSSAPAGVPIVVGDIRDRAFLDKVFAEHKPDAVMHFCASIEVGESVQDPLSYFDNNVSGTIVLLQAMVKANVKYFIFSSTAAVFGEPKVVPITADAPNEPVNPYGDSKYMVERILKWSEPAYGLKSVCLRYFNACGADAAGDIGEDHEPESHLIPLVLQVPLGRRQQIYIFGNDYPTEDGTCIRDYVHVTDLATAHIRALEYLAGGASSARFNLGSGKGYSVLEIIEAARKVTGHPIPAEVKPRRAGDPAALIASSKEAEEVLGWKRKYEKIEDIVATAWKFHQNHPKGYGDHKH
ncbi:hypothetical protein DFJ74DRAFT_650288 [Hyaloraphidium curvatum]|nr:hypothetical protein DFJ74DRAFT_650288 [Hyaloraphidium curvatum]